MLEDEQAIRALLRIPSDAAIQLEDISTPWASIVHLTAETPAVDVVVKCALNPMAAYNELAVIESLNYAKYPYAPTLVAMHGETAILGWIDGATATALLPPPGSVDTVVDALAALHVLKVAEGLRWGAPPEDIVEWAPLPLHRLGFAAGERDSAEPLIADAFEILRVSPWGMTHGDATAANVLLRDSGATLTGWSRAGFGPQLFDLAAFVLSSGLSPAQREGAARRYARARGIDESRFVDDADLLGILWGLGWLLPLPRRQVTVMGDDSATELLVLLANRVERAIREPAGRHPLAAAIRQALWP